MHVFRLRAFSSRARFAGCGVALRHSRPALGALPTIGVHASTPSSPPPLGDRAAGRAFAGFSGRRSAPPRRHRGSVRPQRLGFVPRLSALLSQPVEAIAFVPVDAVSSPIGRELLQQVEEAVPRLARAYALPTNRELVVIESAVGLAEPIGDLELYWIDATYPLPGGDPSCPLHLSISLGLAREGQTWRRLDERVVRTDCDGKERSRYHVYAALAGSPVLLIAEEAAWKQWEKQILRLSPGGLEHVLNP